MALAALALHLPAPYLPIPAPACLLAGGGQHRFDRGWALFGNRDAKHQEQSKVTVYTGHQSKTKAREQKKVSEGRGDVVERPRAIVVQDVPRGAPRVKVGVRKVSAQPSRSADDEEG